MSEKKRRRIPLETSDNESLIEDDEKEKMTKEPRISLPSSPLAMAESDQHEETLPTEMFSDIQYQGALSPKSASLLIVSPSSSLSSAAEAELQVYSTESQKEAIMDIEARPLLTADQIEMDKKKLDSERQMNIAAACLPSPLRKAVLSRKVSTVH